MNTDQETAADLAYTDLEAALGQGIESFLPSPEMAEVQAALADILQTIRQATVDALSEALFHASIFGQARAFFEAGRQQGSDPVFAGMVNRLLDQREQESDEEVAEMLADFGEAWQNDVEDFTINPVEEGMYDDDPSPYAGTYSED